MQGLRGPAEMPEASVSACHTGEGKPMDRTAAVVLLKDLVVGSVKVHRCAVRNEPVALGDGLM